MIESTDETPSQTLIRELGLHMDVTFIPRSQTENASATKLHDMQVHWMVRVYRERVRMDIRTSYSQGIWHLPKVLQTNSRFTSTDAYRAVVDALETGHYRPEKSGYLSRQPLPKPGISDVLYCLVSDASAIEHGSFESWCSEYGCDTDSRKAESVYRACLDTGLKLSAMLGPVDLARLREVFQDC